MGTDGSLPTISRDDNPGRRRSAATAFDETGLPSISRHDGEDCDRYESPPAAVDSTLEDAHAVAGQCPPTSDSNLAGHASHVPGGQRLGRFTLIRLLGEGGFGRVYLAYDGVLSRYVAIKIPRSSQVSFEDERDRFLREGRNSAALDHPGIVRVYDVGRQSDTMYIVSQYVEGQTLAEFLKEHTLSFREAARITAEIADALEYAHQRGIIHRDLKPSNVMLAQTASTASPSAASPLVSHEPSLSDSARRCKSTETLAVGQPRLMDFGLARRVEGDDSQTIAGELLGTPAFMSPEQARGEAYLADERSDVYSLGVVLYQLLVDDLPFRGNLRMVLKQIGEDEPRAPRRLNDQVPRDLETITLKCLSKEPEQRYQTAGELAAELRRFLADEPILARPVSRAERTWRWCRRNPVVSILTATAAFGVLFGFVAATVGYVQTSRALAESEVSFQQAKQAVDDLFTRVSEDTLLNQPGLQPLRRQLLERARDYYQQFLNQRGSRAISPLDQGLVQFRVARITEELDSPEKALLEFELAQLLLEAAVHSQPQDEDLLAALGDTLNGIGRCWQRRRGLEKAEQAYQAAADVRRRLVEMSQEASRQAHFQRLLANCFMHLGTVREGGVPQVALADMETAQGIRRQILKENADLAPQLKLDIQHDLAKGDFNMAKLIASELQDCERADLLFNSALARYSELRKTMPQNLEFRFFRGICLRLSADMKTGRQLYSEAEVGYAEATEILAELVDRNPDVPSYQTALAAVYLNHGQASHEQQRHQNALSDYRRAVALLLDVQDTQSANSDYRRDLVVAMRTTEMLETELGQKAEASATRCKCRDLLRLFVKQFPDDAEMLLQLGDIEYDLRNDESALGYYRQGSQLLLGMVNAEYANSGERRRLIETLGKNVQCAVDMGRMEEAQGTVLALQRLLEQFVERFPEDPWLRSWLDQTHQVVAQLQIADVGPEQAKTP